MEQFLRSWFSQVVEAQHSEEIEALVIKNNWDEIFQNQKDLDLFLALADEYHELIKDELFPCFLYYLYGSNYFANIALFNKLLLLNYEYLDTIGDLSSFMMFEEKFEMIQPVFLQLANELESPLADELMLVLLQGVDYQRMWTSVLTNKASELVEGRLKRIMKRVKHEADLDEDTVYTLGILSDLALTFYSKEIEAILLKLVRFDLDRLNFFVFPALLAHDISIDQTALDHLAARPEFAMIFLKALDKIGCLHLVSSKFLKQDYIALCNLQHWLSYPTELSRPAEQIELVGKIEEKEEDFYVCRFRTLHLQLASRNWMIGISGGFKRSQKPCLYPSSYTFSAFESEQSDPLEQGRELLEALREYEKKRQQELTSTLN